MEIVRCRAIQFVDPCSYVPESPIICISPGLARRQGKSAKYEKLAAVKACLGSCPLAKQVILSWGRQLALTNYPEFKESGLSFRSERDIPSRAPQSYYLYYPR